MAVLQFPNSKPSGPDAPSDEQIARRVLAGETALFEVLMRRHNPRVYRAIRSILRDESEVEDAMQQAYVQAYSHLAGFAGGARFSTWLTRIAMNEALMRVRRKGRADRALAVPEADEGEAMSEPSPEDRAETRELTAILEVAVDNLPEMYRTVFMLREVDELSTAESAEVLSVSEDVVKTRLRRAKALIRDQLFALVGLGAAEAFQFHAPRCDRVVAAVLAQLGAR
jgi:RNA polymerase sigma-70 factor, ECF subfamily